MQDQLLALGLAAKKSKTKKQNKPGPARDKSQTEIPLDQAYRIRGKVERQPKEQTIDRKREQERLRRQINQKIQALIKASAIRDPSADIKRSFIYKGRIRSVLVTDEQREAINNGELGVVYLSGNYHLMPTARVADVHVFAPDHVPDLSGTESKEEKDHPVPDDLTW